MKTKISTVIRYILTALMLYFIYKETGIATTIFATTISIYIELNDYSIAQIRKILFNENKID